MKWASSFPEGGLHIMQRILQCRSSEPPPQHMKTSHSNTRSQSNMYIMRYLYFFFSYDAFYLDHLLLSLKLETSVGSWWKFVTHASSDASVRQRNSQRFLISSLSFAPASNNNRRTSFTCAFLANERMLRKGVIPPVPIITFGLAFASNINRNVSGMFCDGRNFLNM